MALRSWSQARQLAVARPQRPKESNLCAQARRNQASYLAAAGARAAEQRRVRVGAESAPAFSWVRCVHAALRFPGHLQEGVTTTVRCILFNQQNVRGRHDARYGPGATVVPSLAGIRVQVGRILSPNEAAVTVQARRTSMPFSSSICLNCGSRAISETIWSTSVSGAT
jgi:hypothetical protein